MIEIYRRINGKDRLIASFSSLHEFFEKTRFLNEKELKTFGVDPTAKIFSPLLFNEGDFFCDIEHHVYVAYEEQKPITPDRLVGEYRAWVKNYYARSRRSWYNRRDRGARKDAYGRFRRPRTTQERRWASAWDDEDFMPPVRGKRRSHNLPNAWDDVYSHNQKSWKKQSKRRRQWKEK